MLTQEELKRIVTYDPDTGIFRYIAQTNPRALIGQVVGSKQKHGHLSMQYKGKKYQLHQLAFLYMEGYIPEEVDHRDHIPDNNKWNNLRECTRKQNSYNSSLRCNNTSGVKGVSFSKTSGKWRARLTLDGKEIFLGAFATKEEATVAVRQARKHYHGEFAHG